MKFTIKQNKTSKLEIVNFVSQKNNQDFVYLINTMGLGP